MELTQEKALAHRYHPAKKNPKETAARIILFSGMLFSLADGLCRTGVDEQDRVLKPTGKVRLRRPACFPGLALLTKGNERVSAPREQRFFIEGESRTEEFGWLESYLDKLRLLSRRSRSVLWGFLALVRSKLFADVRGMGIPASHHFKPRRGKKSSLMNEAITI